MTQITTPDAPTTDTWAPPGWPAPTLTPPPAPPAKPRNVGWKILGGIIVCLVVVGIVAEADSSDRSSASGSTYTGSSSSMSMTTWISRYGTDDSEMLSDDLTSMTAAAGAGSLSYMASTCRTFQRHVATAQSHLPAPNFTVNSALTDAYGYYDTAADYCIAGDLTRSASYFELGASAIERATTALRTGA